MIVDCQGNPWFRWRPYRPAVSFFPCPECGAEYVLGPDTCRSCEYITGYHHGSTPDIEEPQSEGRLYVSDYLMGFYDGKGEIEDLKRNLTSA